MGHWLCIAVGHLLPAPVLRCKVKVLRWLDCILKKGAGSLQLGWKLPQLAESI